MGYYDGTAKEILEEAKNEMKLRCVCDALFPRTDVQSTWVEQAYEAASHKRLGKKYKSKFLCTYMNGFSDICSD